MLNRLLTSFDRNINFEKKADFGEKIGNFGLGLLRVGFGKIVTVEQISSDKKVVFGRKIDSTGAKVAAIALFILALPITALLAGIGCIGIACSRSHAQIFDLYSQNKKIQPEEVNPDKDRTDSSKDTETVSSNDPFENKVTEKDTDLPSSTKDVQIKPFSSVFKNNDFYKLPALDLSKESLGYTFTGTTNYPDSLKPESVTSSVMRGVNGFEGYNYLIVKYKKDTHVGSGVHIYFEKESKDFEGESSVKRYECSSHFGTKGLSLSYTLLQYRNLINNSKTQDELLAELIEKRVLTNDKNEIIVELA